MRWKDATFSLENGETTATTDTSHFQEKSSVGAVAEVLTDECVKKISVDTEPCTGLAGRWFVNRGVKIETPCQ